MFKKLIIPGVFSLTMGLIGGSYFFKFLHSQEGDRQIAIFQSELKSSDLKQQQVDEILSPRRVFINQHLDINSLLRLYEEDEAVFSVENTSDKFQKIDADLFFLTFKKIDQLINISQSDTDQEKVVKIYNFVKNNSVRTYPLFDYYDDYLSDDLNHNQFFTVYGSGHCSSLAVVFAELAKEYEFESRVWSFNGHVAAEVFYDNEWHFFDPDTLGYFESEDGSIISLDEVKKLASEDKLEKYGDVIASEEDNEILLIDDLQNGNSTILEKLDFYPKEMKLFFDQLYLMSSKGRYITEEGYRQDYEPISYLDEHGKTMANFVRVIPLSNFDSENYIEFDSFFPIVGVFISLPKSFENSDVVPRIKLQSEQIEDDSWIPGEIVLNSDLNRAYIDFSIALRYLENNPSHDFKIEDIEYLVEKYPQAELLVVNAYSYKNADFSIENISEIDDDIFYMNYRSNF